MTCCGGVRRWCGVDIAWCQCQLCCLAPAFMWEAGQNLEKRGVLNVFPALKSVDFHCRRATFRPEQQVYSSIDISVMPSMAAMANPSSYSQAFLAFRATARAARRTACGTACLLGFDVARSVPAGFIAELRSKLRPRCINGRFSLRSIRQSLRDNVADHDQTVLPHQLRGLDMQVMPTRIGDFGVNSPYSLLVAGALGLGQRALVFLEVSRIFDLAAVGQRGEGAQAEIHANFAGSAGLALGNLDLQAEIPAPTGVLREASDLDFAVDGAGSPQPITALEIDHRVAIEVDGARSCEWNPAEAFLPPPVRAAPRGISINNELFADGLYRIAMQTEERAAPGRQLDQIEGFRPRLFKASRGLLNLAAIIPDVVDRPRMGTKALGGGCILDAYR
jgi:hypothetical protein